MRNGLKEELLSEGFSLDKYEEQVLNHGLEKVWDFLIQFLKDNGVEIFSKTIVDFYDIGRLYEIGLAVENKYSKKRLENITPHEMYQNSWRIYLSKMRTLTPLLTLDVDAVI